MVISLPDSIRRSSFSHSSRGSHLRRDISNFKIRKLLLYSLIISLIIFCITFNNSATTDTKQWRKWFYGDDSYRDGRSNRYPPSRSRPALSFSNVNNLGGNQRIDSNSNINLPIITTTTAGGRLNWEAGQPVANGPPLSSSPVSNPDQHQGNSKSSSSLLSSPSHYGCEWTPESDSPLLLLAITSRRTAFKQRAAIRKAYQQILTNNDKVKIEFFIRQRDPSKRGGMDHHQQHGWQEKGLYGGLNGQRRLSLGQRFTFIFINTIRFFDPRNWFPFLTRTSTKSISTTFNKDSEEGRRERETWLERRSREEMLEHQDVIELEVTEHDFSSFRAHEMFNHISRQDSKPAYVMKTDELTMIDVDRVLKSLALEDGELSCNKNVFWGSSSFTWHRSLSGNQVFGRHSYLLSWPLVAWLGNTDSTKLGLSKHGSSTSTTPSTSSTTSSKPTLLDRFSKNSMSIKGPETGWIGNWLTLVEEEVGYVDWKEELHGWIDVKKDGGGHQATSRPYLATRYLWRPEMWKQASEELMEWRRRG